MSPKLLRRIFETMRSKYSTAVTLHKEELHQLMVKYYLDEYVEEYGMGCTHVEMKDAYRILVG
jgi:hypothetical protein